MHACNKYRKLLTQTHKQKERWGERKSVKKNSYRACKQSQLECIDADWEGEARSLLRLVCANSFTAEHPQTFWDAGEETEGRLE